MKKRGFLLMTAAILCLALVAACGEKGQGTYYPDCSEMQRNLLAAGYEVSVKPAFGGEKSEAVYLSAVKGSEYIEFYWLDSGESVDRIYEEMELQHSDYEKLVSIKEDSQFGSVVFCGTSAAVEASGIVIVEVKV